MTQPLTRILGASIVFVALTSLACGGPTFDEMLDEHGGLSFVLAGEPGCPIDDVHRVLEQRIASAADLNGVASVDQQRVYLVVQGEFVDSDGANGLLAPNQVEFARVLRTQVGSPGASGRWLTSEQDPGTHVLVSDPSELGPDTVAGAHAEHTDYGPVVMVTLTPAGADAFAVLTSSQVGQQVAIIIDDEVVSAPHVQEAITEGVVQISMSDWDDAVPLAQALNAPPLPCALTVLETDVIGPSAGR